MFANNQNNLDVKCVQNMLTIQSTQNATRLLLSVIKKNEKIIFVRLPNQLCNVILPLDLVLGSMLN